MDSPAYNRDAVVSDSLRKFLATYDKIAKARENRGEPLSLPPREFMATIFEGMLAKRGRVRRVVTPALLPADHPQIEALRAYFECDTLAARSVPRTVAKAIDWHGSGGKLYTPMGVIMVDGAPYWDKCETVALLFRATFMPNRISTAGGAWKRALGL
jgi:hypothetical protein